MSDAGSVDYLALMDSGLYAELVEAALLIPPEETPAPADVAPGHAKTLQPEAVEFISYPNEWCFGQLRDATLEIQRRALGRGMSLKDASAYNIQFHRGKPVLIDTLSFERYREGEPWVAYRQFCQHFLAPLALMHYRDRTPAAATGPLQSLTGPGLRAPRACKPGRAGRAQLSSRPGAGAPPGHL